MYTKSCIIIKSHFVYCARRAQTSANASNLNQKWSWIRILISGSIRIRIRMSAGSMLWIHYLVGVSHFAECGENWPVTMRNAKKSPKIRYSSMVRGKETWFRIHIRIRINTKILSLSDGHHFPVPTMFGRRPLTHSWVILLTDRQTDRQTDKQTDRMTDEQSRNLAE